MSADAVLARFEGFVECAIFSGRAYISVTSEGVVASTSFDDFIVPFELINSISFADYAISLSTALGSAVFSKLGREGEWFYDKLRSAFDDAVANAFAVEGTCAFEAEGRCLAEEPGGAYESACTVRVYDDCVLLLLPSKGTRRIPFCFMTGLGAADDWSRTFILPTGERYTVSRMGRELENLERIVGEKLQSMRNRTTEWHEELAPMQPLEAAAARRLMCIGTAAFVSELSQSAPRLLAGIEGKVAQSRIAAYYPWLKRIAGDMDYAIGANPPPPAEEGDLVAESEEEPLPIVWVIAPVDGGRFAAVELALADGEAAATYLYRVEGTWRAFAMQICRALEAARFERGPVLLSDEELVRHEHAAEALLVARTPALQLMRRCFAGRAIHASEQRWLNDIEKVLG